MNITDIRLTKFESGNTKAFASITFNDCFVVTGLKVVKGSNGLFVSMPSRKTADGEYKDICFPITADYRQYISDEILAKYSNSETKPDDNFTVVEDDDLPF